MTFWDNKNILITGGAGFLGSTLVKKLKEKGIKEENIRIPLIEDTDLRHWENCIRVVRDIDIVIHLAGKVGGIGCNRRYPAEFFYDNAVMGIQMMEAARQAGEPPRRMGVEKFVVIGTVCSYPKHTPIPLKEKNLWSGYPEETNAPYALAKKMMLVQSQAYRKQYGFNSINLLLSNLYGSGDNFDLESSHVIPATIRKCIEAVEGNKKEIEIWGTGNASREFLYVEDAARAIILATEKYNKSEPINIGTGIEIKIKDLVKLIAKLTGFKGRIVWDITKPDGQPRRCSNISKAKKEFNFEAEADFIEGIEKTIRWWKNER